VTFLSENGKDKNWSVDPAKSDLKITLPGMGEDEDGNVDDLEININAKAGDDIEELATYINGQSDMINASVSEDGKLQVFVAHPNVQGEISISGGLASELGLSDEPIRTSVQDIDMTTVQGSQNAISVLDSALKYVDSQRADLGAKQNRLSHSINN
ncbi:flagellin hook IN motif-containing protein, partial [Vibrio alginolyticus]